MKKAYLICLVVFLLFNLVNIVTLEGDNNRNLQMTNSNISRLDGNNMMGINTGPLYSIISIPFSFHQRLWYFLATILIIVIIPLLISHLTKNDMAPIIYYSISFFWLNAINNSWLKQSLLIAFIILLLQTKKDYQRLIIVLVGSLSHGTGIYVLPIVFILLLLNDYQKKIISKIIRIKDRVLTYSFPIFCNPINPLMEETEKINDTIKHFYLPNKIALRSIDDFLFQLIIPIYFAYHSIKSLYNNKRIDIILLYPLTIISFFWLDNNRALDLIPILSIIGLSYFHKDAINKKIILLYIITWGIIRNSQWFASHNTVFCINK